MKFNSFLFLRNAHISMNGGERKEPTRVSSYVVVSHAQTHGVRALVASAMTENDDGGSGI